MQVGDAVMQALLHMLSATKAGGVQEDAFMALGTLVEGLFSFFVCYLHEPTLNAIDLVVFYMNVCYFSSLQFIAIFISMKICPMAPCTFS